MLLKNRLHKVQKMLKKKQVEGNGHLILEDELFEWFFHVYVSNILI